MNRQRAFLVSSILISLLLVFMMVAPFAGYILTGLLLAFIGFPLQKKIRKAIPENIAAAAIIIATLLVAVLPFGIVTVAVADDAADLVSNVSQGIEIDFEIIDQRLTELTGKEFDTEKSVTSVVKKVGSAIAGSASGILNIASGIVIGLSLMLFTQFYGLKDGGRFIEWTKNFDIMPTEVQEELYKKTGRTTKAVVKGHLLVAIAQGLIAGIGLAIVGIPNFVFWTFVMMVLGIIPLIGTLFVWLPAAAWLFINGNVNGAAILFLWGLLIVGAVDNFLRPFLVDDDADLHPLFIILGVIGGVGVFGIIGLFLGPVIFGVSKTLLEIYSREYDRL